MTGVAPDHLADQLEAGEFRGRIGADELPVAQDCNPIGNRINLIEEMRHENNSKACLLQVPHDLEQALHFVAIEA